MGKNRHNIDTSLDTKNLTSELRSLAKDIISKNPQLQRTAEGKGVLRSNKSPEEIEKLKNNILAFLRKPYEKYKEKINFLKEERKKIKSKSERMALCI